MQKWHCFYAIFDAENVSAKRDLFLCDEPTDANPGASADSVISKLFILTESRSRLGSPNGNCSRICSCESLAFQ
jgi:hypothetical protein